MADKKDLEGINQASEVLNQVMNDFQNEKVFQAFIEANRPLWMRLAVRVLENREEAEDLLQETLVHLWEKKDSLEITNPGAYVARAVWLNSLKRRTRRKAHLTLEQVPEAATREETHSSDEVRLDQMDRLEGALQRLPEEQRKVLQMRYFMDLSFKEIGAALEISLNTAASRTRYALKTLRKILSIR